MRIAALSIVTGVRLTARHDPHPYGAAITTSGPRSASSQSVARNRSPVCGGQGQREVMRRTRTNGGEQYHSKRGTLSSVKLSVIIPTYDTAEMTLVCCASVVAALPGDAEVIVVDDASTDDTARRVSETFPSIVVLRQSVNRGYSAAVNAGVAASRGEVVLLLNSDTRVAPGTLDAFLHAFDDPTLGIAGAQLVNPDGTTQWSAGPVPTLLWMVVAVSGVAAIGRFWRDRGTPHPPSGHLLPSHEGRRTSGSGSRETQHSLSFSPPQRGEGARRADEGSPDLAINAPGWVSGAAMAFRRRVWDVAGPLREDFRFYAQDLDFCVRARRAGWTIRLLEDVRVEHRHGGTIAKTSALPYAPDLLWLDLLTWGRGEYGERWARRARWMMIVAAAARIALRRITGRKGEITAAFVRGYAALRNSRS